MLPVTFSLESPVNRWLKRKHLILFSFAGMGLIVGGIGWFFNLVGLRDGSWVTCSAGMLFVLLKDIVSQLRRGEAGIDILALLTISSSMVLGEYLVGAVIAFMLSSGRALEEYATSRARGELTTLLANAPRTAHRYRGNTLETVAVGDVMISDCLLIKAGEIVPVDGMLTDSTATLDESTLSGESVPVLRHINEPIRSGAINAGQHFKMRSIAKAADSTYTAITRLVEQAQSVKAPFTRLADRYAMLFIPVTLFISGLSWFFSGDAIRALAVLVVATPCPLILAVPIAIISGISRAAHRGILVKDGGALEKLAEITIVLFDKTGTLTKGTAHLSGVETRENLTPDEMLRLAASLDQVSMHVSAQAIVSEALHRSLRLSLPETVEETPGEGIRGIVDGHAVAVGGYHWLAALYGTQNDWARSALRRIALLGQAGAFISVDGDMQGVLLLADEIRLDAAKTIRALRQAGIQRLVMISGDRIDVAETIASALGIDTVMAECSPMEKLSVVQEEQVRGKTLMIGDGINDAPALAAADVGVAMGARGTAVSSEAADVVIMVNRIDSLPEAMTIAKRSRRIAGQSVAIGMGMSILAMFVAAFGYLPPVWGALLQEIIDVTVIFNALRALVPGREYIPIHRLPPEIIQRLRDEHARLHPILDRIDAATRILNSPQHGIVRQELKAIAELLQDRLLPHEREDEASLYPQLEKALHGIDPMAALSRTHREIFHLARLYGNLVAELPSDSLPELELYELRRLLIGLLAILRLHFAQEEEIFQTVAEIN